jgi:hypothetical protein
MASLLVLLACAVELIFRDTFSQGGKCDLLLLGEAGLEEEIKPPLRFGCGHLTAETAGIESPSDLTLRR